MINESTNELVSKIVDSLGEMKGKVIFLSGAAGTGKTTLIKELGQKIPKSVIVASTGIAALSAEGVTIHSFFQLAPEVKPEIGFVLGHNNYQTIQNLDCLIIDEISTVRADLFDAIDARLRKSKDSSLPFGGISIIIAGDPYQLDPVLKKDEEPAFYHGGIYKGVFFFDSMVFKKILKEELFEAYEMGESFRQKGDTVFTDLLDNIRIGKDIPRAIKRFNQMCQNNPEEIEEETLYLTPRNIEAERINFEKLDSLSTEERTYYGSIKDDFYSDRNLPAPKELKLKIGAKVLFIKNDEEDRWVNGSQGIIVNLPRDQTFIQVEVEGKTHDVSKEFWERIKYEYDDELDEFNRNIVGSYSQFPIRLGWAITIHRSQSLTLEKCSIDFGSGAFTHGQAYVALSRTRSIDDVFLITAIKTTDIKVDAKVQEFYQSISFLNEENSQETKDSVLSKKVAKLEKENRELRKEGDSQGKTLDELVRSTCGFEIISGPERFYKYPGWFLGEDAFDCPICHLGRCETYRAKYTTTRLEQKLEQYYWAFVCLLCHRALELKELPSEITKILHKQKIS